MRTRKVRYEGQEILVVYAGPARTDPVSFSISVSLTDLLIECQIYQQMKHDEDPVESLQNSAHDMVSLFVSGS